MTVMSETLPSDTPCGRERSFGVKMRESHAKCVRLDRSAVSVIANRLAGNTETGRHTGFTKIPCVTPCLSNSYDTVEYITA